MRVALVDIDGCLIQDGRLNHQLVQKLKEGNYDKIILFTQRSIFLQVGQIPRQHLLSESADEISTTPEAVQALSEALGRNIQVSTSVDHLTSGALNYYEETLKPFETELDEACIEHGDRVDFSPFNAQVKRETDSIRRRLKADEKALPEKFMPERKDEQYQYLVEELNRQARGEKLEVDFFDDRAPNLVEVHSLEREDIVKPRCFVVRKQHCLELTESDIREGNDNRNYLRDNKDYYLKLLKSDFKVRAQDTREYTQKFRGFGARFKDQFTSTSGARSRTNELQILQKLTDYLEGRPVLGFSQQEHAGLEQLPYFQALMSDRQFTKLFSKEFLTESTENDLFEEQTLTHSSANEELPNLDTTKQLKLRVLSYERVKQKECKLSGTIDIKKHSSKIELATKLREHLSAIEAYEKAKEENKEEYRPEPLTISPEETKLGGRIGELLKAVKARSQEILTPPATYSISKGTS